MTSYVDHYLKTKETIIFLLLTLAGLLICLAILWLFACIVRGKKNNRIHYFEKLADSFFELVFSGGTILFFMAIYYLINRFMFIEPYRSFWDKHSDIILLGLIIISILLGRLIDNVLIRLHCLSHTDKAAIRLVGMVYMILIFLYIKFIYENNNYDMFITYFIGLMIGRFAYFDVSWGDLVGGISGAFRYLPIMILLLAYLSGMSYVGFKSEYLIKHIGVITNIFFIHIFMTVAIAIVFYIYKIATHSHRK